MLPLGFLFFIIQPYYSFLSCYVLKTVFCVLAAFWFLYFFSEQVYFRRAPLVPCNNPFCLFKKLKPVIVKHPVDTALCTSDLQLPASMSCRQLWCPWNSHTFILCSYLLCMFANWTLVASLHFHLELILSSQISSQILIFLEMLHHRNEKPCYAHF